MFNGYNESPLLSYNEFNQDRIEKQENVPKWSYGHDAESRTAHGAQSVQSHSNNRHSEFWSGKSNFLGLPNVVKCSCTGCYSSSGNQSYQGDTSRHRPWLPRTFPVLLNNSSESCKLPAYQWDNGLSGQSTFYPDANLPYVQENGGKYPYYRHYQNSKLPESNQPGVITSVKDTEYVKKPKNEMPSRILESPIQNCPRQPVFCNSAYNLTKRTDERNYCEPNDKYSNAAPYTVDQHVPRLPVVEPFIKAVPSNLSQNRVPSTGYRNVKENIPQPYIDSGFGDSRKICSEPTVNNDKRNKAFSTGQLQGGAHVDYSHMKRDLHEEESQKSFFDNCRHSDYFPRGSIQDSMKRNNQILDNKKDYAINQMGMPEQHYNVPRSKYPEVENSKFSYEAFYPEEFEKVKLENHLLDNSACYQRIEDNKNENMNIHARLPRSALVFNGPRFDNTQNSFPYQNDPASYRNHIRPEYSHQNFNSQVRFEYPAGFQRNDFNQCRVTPQQVQNGEQFNTQQNSSLVYNLHCQQNPDKTQQVCGDKNPSPFHADSQSVENKKMNYLEAVRSEEVKKNGTSKISPLRLLRKKKFINVPHESTPASTLDSAPGLDVRKFWSTWAEEEEENLTPSQMVVLDCQNIDPEQAKLLNLYETDPVRSVHFESGNIVIKSSNCSKDPAGQAVQFEQIKTYEELVTEEPKMAEEQKNCENEKSAAIQEKETEKAENISSTLVPDGETKPAIIESTCQAKSPPKPYRKLKCGQRNRSRKKSETIDKWTEKKFDFLKRAEESKAAEILRHEEEKKKIFETRQSIQQSLKKTENRERNIFGGDESVPERVSSFDESVQSDSPQDESSDALNLPTSEYRRNKFLDYSDRKVINKVERDSAVNPNSYTSNLLNEEEIKKEEDVKSEDKRPEKHPTETSFPSLNAKLKEETDDDNPGINFQSSEMKSEEETENDSAKKSRPLVKKPKRKKSDQTEGDDRKDKLTVETVTKPTIKFSIGKSHDLKISFKVLNSNKEYSDCVDVRGEETETKKNAVEDSKNSTEMITLKYKSIQRDGERRQSSDFMRNRRKYRRKKRAPEKKTPVLKIKKSRYMSEKEERNDDSFPDDNERLNISKKPYSDEYASSEDFQVQETVDSAKIKLTFKRHKGNFETECKINGNNIEKVSAPESDFDKDSEMAKSKKKPRKAKKQELTAETDIENLKNNSGPSSDAESGSENLKPGLEPVFEEDSRNLPISSESGTEKANFKPKVPIFSELPLEYDKLTTIIEERRMYDAIEDLQLNEENNILDREQVELTGTRAIDCDGGDNGSENIRGESSLMSCNDASLGVSLKESTMVEAQTVEKNQENTESLKEGEIQEISIDFIKSTKSQEIETNHISGKTEETETSLNNNAEALEETSSHLESSNEIKHSPDPVNSDKYKSDGNPFASKNLKIIDDLYEPLDNDDSDGLSDNLSDKVENKSNDLEEISNAFLLSSSELENENIVPPENDEAVVENKSTNDVLPSPDRTTDPNLVEKCENDFEGNMEKSDSIQEEPDNDAEPDLEVVGDTLLKSSIENSAANDTSPPTETNRAFCTSEASPKDFRKPGEFENLIDTTEKLNESANGWSESPSLAHLQPEENFKLSLKSKKNAADSDIECEGMHVEGAGNESKEVFGECSFPPLEEVKVSEAAFEDANMSVDIIQSDTLTFKDPDGDRDDDGFVQDISLSEFQEVVKCEAALHFSPKTGQSGGNVSECAIPSDSNQNIRIDYERETPKPDTRPESPLLSDIELEEGEIIDSSDEYSPDPKQTVNGVGSLNEFGNSNKIQRKNVVFISRSIQRRHSTVPETITDERGFENNELVVPSKKEFSRAKSCPPEFEFPQDLFCKMEEMPNILPEDIPLPIGPPPYSSCFNLEEYLSVRTQAEHVCLEAKEEPKESIVLEQSEDNQKEIPPSDLPFGSNSFQNCLKPVEVSPLESAESVQSGIFQRSSKIKFSFSKRSRLSKIDLKKPKESKIDSPTIVSKSKIETESEKPKAESPDRENKTIQTQMDVSAGQNSPPNECQIKEMPNVIFAGETEEAKSCGDSEEVKKCRNDLEQPIELLCEELDEKVEVIDALNDFITDEFYECEDIPTSEDLTNGGDDDLENEKVNDDKFRNIMQNCLDNAKKFLNVGNLKLFSCSVDDLLELDCQTSESALGESEPEKSANHISRDVLLTSCEDTSDDLGLSENVPPPDISMDFLPSFCSDVCSEILPVDNWPYLEEEVPSSPTKSKQDETDLIPSLENASLDVSSESCLKFCTKNGIERSMRKHGENNFKSFRRRSLVSDENSSKMSSKIDAQRRKTIESLTGGSDGRSFFDAKSEKVNFNREANQREKRSLKCRLSLEKLIKRHESNLEFKSEKMKREHKSGKKSAKSLNYKSPSWQPRVMLCRISKNDLRKVVKSSGGTHRPSGSENSENLPSKKEILFNNNNNNNNSVEIKRHKHSSKFECEERKIDGGTLNRERLVDLSRLDTLKGSLTPATSTNADVKRSRKSRFRNLHSKRKVSSDTLKDSFAQNVQIAEPTDAETILIKMFKDCNASSDSLTNNTKEVSWSKNGDEKKKINESRLAGPENHHHQDASRRSEGMSKEDSNCERDKKSHSHRDKRDKKREGRREEGKQGKHRESESKKSEGRHSRSGSLWRSSSGNGEHERYKREKCRSEKGRWVCEVCGFDDVSERIVHIKSHPLHCQSCHLAFKTESHFISHLTRKHKDIQNQHHCLLCELSFDTQEQYRKHLETREHRHLESVEKNTINTLFTVLTGAPCPVLGLVETRPEWLPNQAGTVHFYHQATPLSLALQRLFHGTRRTFDIPTDRPQAQSLRLGQRLRS